MYLNRVITRRQLGWTILALGALGAVGLLGLDLIRAPDRIVGPAQKLGFVVCAVLAVIGITLAALPMSSG